MYLNVFKGHTGKLLFSFSVCVRDGEKVTAVRKIVMNYFLFIALYIYLLICQAHHGKI